MEAGSTASVLPITAGPTLPDAAGGKARGLQRIAAAGLPLPDSWCLLPGTGEEDLGELTEELESRGHFLLAVRSSARDEDQEQASFAGVHVSLLGVRPAELPAAVRTVAASSLSERAQAYREHLGLPPATEPCAVVVQPVILGDCAGVAFAIDGDRPSVVIEAVRGLGETLVEGRAVPESVTLSWRDGGWAVEGRRGGRQTAALVPSDGRLRRVALTTNHDRADLLSPALCNEIASGVAALEAWEGGRRDIEWVSQAGAVSFVQARPQTRPLAPELPPGEIWTRVNVRDVLPEIPSAFSRSLLPIALDAAVRDSIRSYGMEPDPGVPHCTSIYGRPVFNERVFTVADRLGVPREALQANMGGSGEPSPRLPRTNQWKTLRHPLMLIRALRIVATIERRVGETIERNRGLQRRLEAIDLDSVSPEYFRHEIPGLMKTAQGIAVEAQYLAGALSFAQDQALPILEGFVSPQSLLSRLVAGGECSVTTRQIEELLEVAMAMRRSHVDGFVREITSEDAREFSAGRWEEGEPDAVHRDDGVSPGAAEGPVCVLLSPEDGGRLEMGAILVAPATDPAWTPLFARASGVIVELGGMLSHSGIVAREYGIPCVANVRDATRVLRDGDRVHLDGTSGTVRTVPRADLLDSGGRDRRAGKGAPQPGGSHEVADDGPTHPGRPAASRHFRGGDGHSIR